jgi:uncharacterized protein
LAAWYSAASVSLLPSVKQLKVLTNTATPLDPSTRIDAIDVLRGIALFGVLAVNLVTEFRVSIFQQFLPDIPHGTSADRAVEAFVSLALESKAFSLFSLLFGLGLAIQFERLARSGSPLRWLVRRLAVLLVIGLIHLFLIWNGDILTEYALAGFVALPFLFAPRWALLAGCAAFILLYLILPLLSLPVSWPTPAWLQQHVNEASAVYATGNAADVLRFSIREIQALLPLHIYVFPRTVALFLLGAFIWRTGLFKEVAKHEATLFPAASVCLIVGWLLTSSVLNVLSALAPVFLALGYAASVIWLMTFTTVSRWLEPVGALGRMAFTNYLLQSVVFGWVFFGYGLGLFGKLGTAPTIAIGAVVYGIQVLLSSWWLRHFRFGPVEWLWRTLMYGTRQPMARVPVQ